MKPTKKKVEIVKEGKTYKPKTEQASDFDKAAFKKRIKDLEDKVELLGERSDTFSQALDAIDDLLKRTAGRLGIE